MKYYVVGDTAVYRDSFEHGELEYVNSWQNTLVVDTDTVTQAVENFIADSLYIQNPQIQNDEGRISNSSLVDVDNCELSEVELIAWREDRFVAYNQYTSFTVYKMEEVTNNEDY